MSSGTAVPSAHFERARAMPMAGAHLAAAERRTSSSRSGRPTAIGELDVLQPHETMAALPGGVECEVEQRVDLVERRAGAAADVDRAAPGEQLLGVDAVPASVLVLVHHVPVQVDADPAHIERDRAGTEVDLRRPRRDRIRVAGVLHRRHRVGETVGRHQDVEVGVATHAGVAVHRRAQHRALEHQPRDAGRVEHGADASEHVTNEEVVGGRLAAADRETIEHDRPRRPRPRSSTACTQPSTRCEAANAGRSRAIAGAGAGDEISDPRMGLRAARGRRRRDQQLLDRSRPTPAEARPGRARHRGQC